MNLNKLSILLIGILFSMNARAEGFSAWASHLPAGDFSVTNSGTKVSSHTNGWQLGGEYLWNTKTNVKIGTGIFYQSLNESSLSELSQTAIFLATHYDLNESWSFRSKGGIGIGTLKYATPLVNISSKNGLVLYGELGGTYILNSEWSLSPGILYLHQNHGSFSGTEESDVLIQSLGPIFSIAYHF